MSSIVSLVDETVGVVVCFVLFLVVVKDMTVVVRVVVEDVNVGVFVGIGDVTGVFLCCRWR